MTYNKKDKMNGLEALNRICNDCESEEYKLIKKDLEILEILKKSMSVDTEVFENDNHEVVEYEYIAFNDWELDIENKEEYNKIKEWLQGK